MPIHAQRPRAPASLSLKRIMRISDCIDRWTSNPGEHRRLGAKHATALVMRLVAERGRRRRGGGRGDADMMWESYRLPSLARCLNASYAGGDFVDWALSIVTTFKDEYVGRRCASRDNDARIDDGDDGAAGGGATVEIDRDLSRKYICLVL